MEVYAVFVDWKEGKPELYSEVLYKDIEVANQKAAQFSQDYGDVVKFFVKPFDVE